MTETLIPFLPAACVCLVLAGVLAVRGFWIAVRWRKRYRLPALQAVAGFLMALELCWGSGVFLMAYLSQERGTLWDIAAAETALRQDIATGYRELGNNWPMIVEQTGEIYRQTRNHLHQTGWLPEF
jgi:hypothetical protein